MSRTRGLPLSEETTRSKPITRSLPCEVFHKKTTPSPKDVSVGMRSLGQISLRVGVQVDNAPVPFSPNSVLSNHYDDGNDICFDGYPVTSKDGYANQQSMPYLEMDSFPNATTVVKLNMKPSTTMNTSLVSWNSCSSIPERTAWTKSQPASDRTFSLEYGAVGNLPPPLSVPFSLLIDESSAASDANGAVSNNVVSPPVSVLCLHPPPPAPCPPSDTLLQKDEDEVDLESIGTIDEISKGPNDGSEDELPEFGMDSILELELGCCHNSGRLDNGSSTATTAASEAEATPNIRTIHFQW